MTEARPAMWHQQGDVFVPDFLALAPWDAGVLHGGALSGLIAQCVQSRHCAHLAPSRMNVDLLKVAGSGPIRVATFVVHERPRSMVVDVLAWSSDDLVALGRVLLLRVDSDARVPDRLPHVPEPVVRLADSIVVPPSAGKDPSLVAAFDARIGMIPGTSRSLLWLRMRCDVVAGERATGFSRAAVAADWVNAVSNGEGDGISWINADANLAFGREPIGEWLAIVPRQRIVRDGRSTSTCGLFDVEGTFASASVSAVVARRRTRAFI